MTDIQLVINMEDERWQQALPDISEMAENIKNTVFSYVEQHAEIEILNIVKPIFIGVCLSDNQHVQSLNKTFRGMDKPTNVLSFANLDDPDFCKEMQYYPEVELGNIILAYEKLVEEVEEQQISLKNHFCHLLAHGLLHLLGYDHIDPADATEMENMEINVLNIMGIENPYEEI